MPLMSSHSRGNFACSRARNDVLMNLNASAGMNACPGAAPRRNEMILVLISRVREEGDSPQEKLRNVTATRPWCTTRVSPSNFVAARVAALKQFVVLFIAASYTPGPNFVDRDKIIFRTGGRASRPTISRSVLASLALAAMLRQYGAGK